MKGIKNILLLLVLTIVVSTMSASAASINLCEKVINTGGSWGVCTDAPGMAQGVFTYIAAGSPPGVSMDFTATASGLSDGEYSLIYYKDTDPAHTAPTTKTIYVLGTGTSASGSLTISGMWSGGDIPASDDINPRGKIWIVPTNRIKSDGKLDWTGYANGAVINDMMFESDLVASDGASVCLGVCTDVQKKMGGITYDMVSSGSVQTQVTTLVGDLYRITLAPATATVIPTGTQIFTAAGTDQGGLPVTITPIWSVSGATESTVLVTGSETTTLTVGRFEQAKDITIIATSGSVVGTATVSIPEVKSISVNHASVSFGSVQRGKPSSPQTLVITNEGNVATNVAMVASDLVSGTDHISGINLVAVPAFSPSRSLTYMGSISTDLTLTIPVDAPLGTYTGTVDFSTI